MVSSALINQNHPEYTLDRNYYTSESNVYPIEQTHVAKIQHLHVISGCILDVFL